MRKRQLYFSNQNITKGKGRSKRSKLKSIGMTAALLSMVSLVTPAAVYAAPETTTDTQEVASTSTFEMSTAYPGISVKLRRLLLTWISLIRQAAARMQH